MTYTKIALESVKTSLELSNFDLYGFSRIGQILYPHLEDIRVVLERDLNKEKLK